MRRRPLELQRTTHLSQDGLQGLGCLHRSLRQVCLGQTLLGQNVFVDVGRPWLDRILLDVDHLENDRDARIKDYLSFGDCIW